MDLKTFLENFDTIAEAPGGIPKLRLLILDLAVRGKLVPQNPEDEPASKLLPRIKNEFKELINQKKIRKIDLLPVLKDDEVPFNKPTGWEWCRLGEIVRVSSGENLTSHKMTDGGKIPVFGGNGITGYHDQSNVHKPTLVIGRVGFYCGSVHITPKLAWVTDNAFITTFSENCIYIHFLYWLLKAIDLQQNNSATAQPVISGGKIYSIPVSFPPLAEQKRIVEKVDELMALCDRFSSAKQTRDNLRQKLRESAIASLMSAETDKELEKRWAIIRDNWCEVSQYPEDIDSLRQTILHLAVRGKLVPQNPNDEPAEKSLKIIATKHASYAKKFRKPKDIPSLKDVDKPFELPFGWSWCRFTEIGQLDRGKSKHRPRNDSLLYENGSIPLVQTGDVARANGVIETYTALYNHQGLVQSRLWSKGTLCITIAANIGDSAILGFDACFPDSIVGFLPTEPISDSRYFEFLIRTLKSRLEDFAPSTAQKNINLGILDEVLIPLPPLAEQKRIVAKVDELMKLCDQLEASLRQSQQRAESLAASAISHLII